MYEAGPRAWPGSRARRACCGAQSTRGASVRRETYIAPHQQKCRKMGRFDQPWRRSGVMEYNGPWMAQGLKAALWGLSGAGQARNRSPRMVVQHSAHRGRRRAEPATLRGLWGRGSPIRARCRGTERALGIHAHLTVRLSPPYATSAAFGATAAARSEDASHRVCGALARLRAHSPVEAARRRDRPLGRLERRGRDEPFATARDRMNTGLGHVRASRQVREHRLIRYVTV